MKTPKLFDQIFRDKAGNLAIASWPNAPLWAWIGLSLLSMILHGTLKTLSSSLSELALAIWAVWEIARGLSLFRRLLGGVVLIAVITGLVSKLLK